MNERDKEKRLRGAEGRRWRPQRTMALGMSVLMAISGLSLPVSSAGTERESGQIAGLELPLSSELTKAPALMVKPPAPSFGTVDEFVAQVDALSVKIPKAHYDLEAAAQALDPGIDPAFLFVRDHIRYEAYPGVLRGPGITLATRAGNACDRSLFLAGILKRKGIHTRIARGRLERPQAERLFARIFEPTPQLPADAESTAAAARQPEAAAFEARLRTRAVRDYAAIRKALGDALPSGMSPSREQVLREIEEHVWVQAEVDGRWVDLDSAFAEAEPGRTYTAAEQTFEALPKESYQRVTIRIISETLASGSLKTDMALEFSANAAELLDRQVFLTHVPGGGGGLGGAMTGGIMGKDTWTPALWVNGQFHIGKPIAFREGQKPVERGKPPTGGLVRVCDGVA